MALVEIAADAGVTILTLNRPEKRNAVLPETQKLLMHHLRGLKADGSVRAVVITGAGSDFCVGGDFDLVEEMIGDADLHRELTGLHSEVADCILSLEIPAIAAVNGPALGFGAELAAFCDMVVMSENASLCDPHVRFGLGPAPGALLIWPQLTSRAIAAELMLTGRVVPAQEALRLGLANRVVPEGQALAAAVALAQELCALPWEGVKAVKQALRRSYAELAGGRGPVRQEVEARGDPS